MEGFDPADHKRWPGVPSSGSSGSREGECVCSDASFRFDGSFHFHFLVGRCCEGKSDGRAFFCEELEGVTRPIFPLRQPDNHDGTAGEGNATAFSGGAGGVSAPVWASSRP